jgi:phosphatidylserine synthase 2
MSDDVAEQQQRTVLRVRKGSDLSVYGNEGKSRSAPHSEHVEEVDDENDNENEQPRASNYENRKWSMEEMVSIEDENDDEWTSNPRTLTCGFLLMVWIVYAAFHEPDVAAPTDAMTSAEAYATGLKRGAKYAAVFFLTYCALQLPDGHFIRPHPVVWRLITGAFILYEMLLIVLLFLRTSDARAFFKIFDPTLGVELPEESYAADCRLYTPENPESHFYNLRNTFFDRFVVMHFLGWFIGALMMRSYFTCWTLSVMFEWYELSFRHWLPNFHECWWDHVFLDIFSCNALGIYFGMKVCKWLEMKKYNWVGIRKIPNLTGKARRALAQFTPAYWLAYDWKIFRSADRFWRVMSMITILSLMMLNSFFLKTVLWIPASSPLNVYRLLIWYTAGSYAVAEYYIFSTFTVHVEGKRAAPVQKLGPRAWLGVVVVATEVCVIVKHGAGMFTAPFPLYVKLGWALIFAVVGGGSSIYFAFLNKPPATTAVHKKRQ